jgi:hypothetical protein
VPQEARLTAAKEQVTAVGYVVLDGSFSTMWADPLGEAGRPTSLSGDPIDGGSRDDL